MTETGYARVGYQPALDGVRAVAVIAVVLYHGGVPWMSGGFLGVDGFFVVSGFLITTLLVDEFAATGRIDIRGFWLRRIRRLVPAVLLLAGVVMAWALLVDPTWAGTLGGDVIAALSYVSNWRFIFDERSYFEVFGSPSPLRHTWSLAIEEQWYALWPLLIAAVFGSVLSRRDTMPIERLVMWCSFGCVALALSSAVWMRHLAAADAEISRLYFGTDTRAQALLIGAALGFAGWQRLGAPPRPQSLRTRAVATIGFGAAVGVTGALVTVVDIDDWLYTGGFLMIAVAWAIVVAAATNGIPGPIQTLLGSAPFVAVGRLSYGIYLWHWPVQLVVTPSHIPGSLLALNAARLGLTFALAAVSYALVENPIRVRRILATPRPLLIGVATGTVGVAAMAALLASAPVGRDRLQALPVASPPPPAVNAEFVPADRPASLLMNINPVSIDPASTEAPTAPITTVPTWANTAVEPIDVVVVGDSVAFVIAYYSGDVDELSIENRGQMGCGVIPEQLWVGNRRIRRAAACERWIDEWASASDGDVVLAFIGSWDVFDPQVDGQRLSVGSERWTAVFSTQLQRGVDAVAGAGAHLALASVPCYDTAGMVGEIPSTERDDPARVEAVNAAIRSVADANVDDVTVIDWAGYACPGGEPRTLSTGDPLRPDGIHTDSATTPDVWTWLSDELRALRTR